MPYLVSGTIRIDGDNQNDLGNCLTHFLIAVGPQHIPGDWHQRSYGTAQIQLRQKNPPVKGDRIIGAA